MLLAFLLAGQVSAQEQLQLTVYDGTATNSYVPVYGHWMDAYNKIEMVYPATELSDMTGGDITSLKFYTSSAASSAWTATCQVFLKEVDYTTINEYSGVNDATLVFEGQLDGTKSVMEIVFSTPYYYTGGNLLVGIYNNPGNWSNASWYGETVNGASIQGYNSNGPDNVSPTQKNFLPKTTFTYEISPFEIATAEDLYEFAAAVNSGKTKVNAFLTADIVVNENVLLSDGSLNEEESESFTQWTPIGTESNPFKGTFDGRGHTISGLYFYNTDDEEYPNGGNNVGLIGEANGATIKSVGLIDSYLHGSNQVAGICSNGEECTITNCYNASTIIAENVSAGIAAFNLDGDVSNCFNVGTVSGNNNVGGIYGFYNGTASNCFVLNGSVSNANGGTFATAEQFASGEVAYLINENAEKDIYYQNIGTDPVPSLDESHGIVYGSNGNYYTHLHSYDDNGFCECNMPEKPVFNGAAYEIDNAGKLYWFANHVGFDAETSANAVLTADIVVNSNLLNNDGSVNTANMHRQWWAIGDAQNKYTGTFDGQGHSISGLYTSNSNNYCGLVGYANNATIKNVEVLDSYFRGSQYVGGICGYIEGKTLITNCHSAAKVDGNSYVGGICGYMANGTISYCFSTGIIEFAYEGIFGDRNNGTTSNNYILLYGVDDDEADDDDDGVKLLDIGGEFKTAKQFASGEVAYLLNQENSELSWRQTIGTDNLPTLNSNSATVYLTSPCQSYSNTSSFKAHELDSKGFCTVCGGAEEAAWNNEANAYEIACPGQLYWFAEYVNSGNGGANAILTADIVVNEDVLDAEGNLNGDLEDNDFITWTPIGTNDNNYYGQFDGQGHTVSGLYFYNTDDENYPVGGGRVGLIGTAGNGATITNVGVVDSYLHGVYNVGGIVGRSDGSLIAIANCFNTSTIVAESNAGGIVGLAYSDNPNNIIINCFNTGKIIGDDEFIGSVIGQNNTPNKLVNCYYLEGSAICNGKEQSGEGSPYGFPFSFFQSSTAATAEQFSSGFVAGRINAKAGENIYYQTIGSDAVPTLNNSHGVVYTSLPCPVECSNNPDELSEIDHVFENGFCTVCGAHEPATWNAEANAFEIGNAGQLYWFADMVNSGELYDYEPNAYLSADIAVNTDLTIIYEYLTISTLIEWTPIGNDDYRYVGTFDGKGHTISGLFFESDDYYIGLFGVTYDATIKNLGITGSYFGADAYVGGIIGRAEGETEVINCFNTSTIHSYDEDSNAGGICGYISDNSSITNCYSTGEVRGVAYTGSIVGQADGSVSNCYYLKGSASSIFSIGGGSGVEFGGVGHDEEYQSSGYEQDGTYATTIIGFRNGAVAYALNGSSSDAEDVVWYQTLGSDKTPTLNNEHGVVYASEPCPYNNAGVSHKEHEFVNGECVCGLIDEPVFNTEANAFEIANAGQLYWFAEYVNNYDGDGDDFVPNAILTADIVVNENVLNQDGGLNLGDFKPWTPIGYAANGGYTGIFNGQGHTISGLYYDNESYSQDAAYPECGTNAGLFSAARPGAEITNVGLVDSYIYGANNVGGILGYSNGGVAIVNCYNTSTIISDGHSKVSYCGGICGKQEGCFILNCYNTGKVQGDGAYVGAIAGNYGEREPIFNCYYLEGCAINGDRVIQNGIGTNTIVSREDVPFETISATAEQFASGYVAYLINQNADGVVYYQTLGEDTLPTLDSSHGVVYASSPCTAIISNNPEDASEKEHEFENGFCTACGAFEEATWNDEDEVYEIANAGQLYWFAKLVNTGELKYDDAVLTADIIVNENVLDEDDELNEEEADNFRAWTPIGTYNNPYSASFNGKGHTISGLYFNNATNNVGLFGTINDAEIDSVGIVDSYIHGNRNVGGICGYQSDSKIASCFNAGTIKVGNNNVGGISGYMEEALTINCYNIGNVGYFSKKVDAPIGSGVPIGVPIGIPIGIRVPETNAGGIVGYLESGDVYNCYNAGDVYGNRQYGGIYGSNGNGSLNNCYVLEGTVPEDNANSGTFATIEQFACGYVGFMLNRNDNNAWHQNLFADELPTLNNSKNLVTGYTMESPEHPYIVVLGDIVLTTDYEVPEDKCLIIPNEGSLAMTDDIALTVNGKISFDGGLIVYNGDTVKIGRYYSPNQILVAQKGNVFSYSSIVNGKIQVEAVPNEGYHFARWTDDENAGAQRTISLNAPGEYYAKFDINFYEVDAIAVGGTVDGTGSYAHGSEVTLTAIPDEGYQFVRWGDGSTESSLVITVLSDTTIEAVFVEEDKPLYTVNAIANNGYYGFVDGGSIYYEGETATLTANASEHYHFVQWNDSDKNNPRYVEVSMDSSFEATFAIDTFNLSIIAEHGVVEQGEGDYAWGERAYISVLADEGYYFSHWTDDNSTSRTRYYAVKDNTTLEAVFEPYYYDVNTALVGSGEVQGAGNYAFGTEVTLTAVPATGYHFIGWNDNEQSAQRKVTVREDAYFTAYFEINTYNVTVETENGTVEGVKNGVYTHGEEATFTAVADANYKFARWTTTNTTNPFVTNVTSNMVLRPLFIPEDANVYTLTVTAGDGGSAAGSGNYVTNEKARLTATPNQGYRFVKWSDGSTKNPYEYTVTKEATIKAQFAINSYELEVLASANGTVTGSGTFTYGTETKVTAAANEGYHFVRWSDGNTNAERTITVSGDITVTAEFAINTYAVKASAKNGKVEGTGTYNHGQKATLNAVANTGYHFSKWNDGVTTESREVTVTSELSFTAEFEINSYAVKLSATNGTVEGAGTYTYGEKATVSATAAEGYHFTQWSDGLTMNPRVVLVTSELEFAAEFAVNTYDVRVSGTNGTVTGAGTYNYGAEATLTATAAEGYHFTNWNDGVETATRKVTVKDNLSFTAEFAANTYTISVDSVANGTITGAGAYTYGATATLVATADKGYHFVMWTDSVTTETRTVRVVGNATFSAVFAANTYTLTVKAKNNGTVEGSGTYGHGAEATITATANAGYIFSKWDDGNTDNPRKVTVTGNKTYTASFKKETYAVTVNAKYGNITASSNTLQLGATITLTAVADSGYHFVMWSDSVLDNPRTVTLTAELLKQVNENGFEFTAIFEKDDNTAIADEAAEDVNIFAFGNTIVVENAASDIFIYDAMGRLINRTAAEAGRTEIQVNGSGVYIVKTGNTAKRVVIND